jgi:endonuclease YncB( thermonuclease family)
MDVKEPAVLGVRRRAVPVLLAMALCACLLVACSSGGSVVPTSPAPSPVAAFTVVSVTDGDTLRFSPAVDGATSLRLLQIDAPESAQAPWGEASRTALLQLAPASSEITIETDQTRVDSFDRVLGHAIRRDGLNLNLAQLRAGHAALYVIWPNISRFADYRAAQIEAQSNRRGIWDPAEPLGELPFEYRLRIDRDAPFRPAGDYFTRTYVEPADYRRVHVNNRVFFNTRADAAAAGYQACPRDDAGAYVPVCFASGQ